MATALSNGPLPANRVVASILSYYETRSTRERVATTRFPRLTTLTTVRMIFRNVSLYQRAEEATQTSLSRGCIGISWMDLREFVKLIFWSAEGEVVEEFSRKPRVPSRPRNE